MSDSPTPQEEDHLAGRGVTASKQTVLVLGGTGRTGGLVIEEALLRGYPVIALVRNSTKIEPRAGLRLVVGLPCCAEDIAPLLEADTVVSCLGQRTKADAALLWSSANAVIRAMGKTQPRRYIVVSQGLLFASRNPLVLLLRWLLARFVRDSRAMENTVRSCMTDWTIVRPPRLTGGAPRGYIAERGALPVGRAAMERRDLAAFLLDEVERKQYVQAVVGVTSA